MRIAIEGCCHGQLDDIYGTIRLLEQRENYKIDLVLICGDFQSLRNTADMECMAVPFKYRELGTFWKYYSGKVQAPYPTIFIGGNHEASNYLWELYHGGWVCDNIYYLGHAGVVNFGGLRIGGLSGISKDKYDKGHYETSPYNPSDIRSAYYVREYDVKKLLNVSDPLDIFLSHDWPRGVERHGDLESLMRKKEYFISEILSNSLGSQPNELILSKIQPDYWFSAHLHVHYAALVNHDMYKNGICPAEAQATLDKFSNPTPVVVNPDKIDIDLDDDLGSDNNNLISTKEETKPCDTEEKQESKYTKFLSLDKCLPRREFLQVVDIPSKNDEMGDFDFYYDLEWLAITKATQPYLSTSFKQTPLPSDEELKATIENEKLLLKAKVERGILDLKIPHNFEPTAPPHNPEIRLDQQTLLDYQRPFSNPQTIQFCKEFGIENKINANARQTVATDATEFHTNKKPKIDTIIESEIKIDDEFL